MFKIISSKRYDKMRKFQEMQNNLIFKLQKENAELKALLDKSIYKSDHRSDFYDLDFPNSDKEVNAEDPNDVFFM